MCVQRVSRESGEWYKNCYAVLIQIVIQTTKKVLDLCPTPAPVTDLW